MMQRWIKANRAVLLQACASTIVNIMHVSTHYMHPAWSGVKLCRTRDGVSHVAHVGDNAPFRLAWRAPSTGSEVVTRLLRVHAFRCAHSSSVCLVGRVADAAAVRTCAVQRCSRSCKMHVGRDLNCVVINLHVSPIGGCDGVGHARRVCRRGRGPLSADHQQRQQRCHPQALLRNCCGDDTCGLLVLERSV